MSDRSARAKRERRSDLSATIQRCERRRPLFRAAHRTRDLAWLLSLSETERAALESRIRAERAGRK